MDRIDHKPDVTEKIAEIKRFMPEVYKVIQDKAQAMGPPAYALVRRGLRGEPSRFFAFEGGRVVGTPFDNPDINTDVAALMVRFGCASVCIFGPAGGGDDGAH